MATFAGPATDVPKPDTAVPSADKPAGKGFAGPAPADAVSAPKTPQGSRFVDRMSADVNADAAAVKQTFEAPHAPDQSFVEYTKGSLLAIPRQVMALGKMIGDMTGIPRLQEENVSEPVAKILNKAGGLTGKNKITPEDVDTAIAAGIRPGAGGLKPVAATPTIAERAVETGYVLPPKMTGVKQGVVGNALEGWGGRIKLEQSASAKNQLITNKLAAKSLGLPDDTLLTEEVFRKVRSEAWDDYKAVARALPQTTPDPTFWKVVDNLGKTRSEASSAFPRTLARPAINDFVNDIRADFGQGQSFSTDAAMEWVRQMRSDASLNIGNKDPGTRALGYAQRQAANAIDDLIERNVIQQVHQGGGVTASIDPAVVDNYRKARQRIAISHDLEAATNVSTGDVSAHAVSALLSRGRPLSGDLRTIGEIASAFPRATRFSSSYGGVEPWSALDMVGVGVSAATGSPEAALTFLGRPLARGVVLSRPYQQGSRLTGRGVATPPGVGTEPGPGALVLAPSVASGAPSIVDAINPPIVPTDGRRDR